MNRVLLRGIVAKKPYIYAKYGSIMVKTVYEDAGRERQSHVVVGMFKDTLDTVKGISQGDEVFIEGRVQQKKSMEEGQEVWKQVVIAREITIGKGPSGPKNERDENYPSKPQEPEDDFPF